MTKMLESALSYATKMHWRIFPCKLDKTPYTANGFKDATTDPEQIKAWWQEHPTASIGIACGPEAGVWVLDVDVPNKLKPNKPDGRQSLGLLEEKHGKLPATLVQKTGGGGYQHFWKWNGREIRNSSSEIAPGLDIRGNGGYVILPPSGHELGNKYEWVNKMQPAEAPKWLIDLIYRPTPQDSRPASQSGSSAYGEAALAKELVNLSHAEENMNRNNTLNKAAYSLGQLIAGGELDRVSAESALLGVAISKGLKEKEATKTIQSGITAGMKEPRNVPHDDSEYYFDHDEISKVSEVSEISAVSSSKQEVSRSKQEVSKVSRDGSEVAPYNIAAHIREWIINSTGSFTVEQLDREFCLKTRAEKNNRAKCLSLYKDQNLIKKDLKIKGKYYVIDSTIEWVDLSKADEAAFPITLPFNLHEKVHIPHHSIIVLAGSSNAGKTAVILNTLKLNMKQDYEKIYLMSEMSDGEYKDRVLSFGDPISLWQQHIKAAPKSYDFDGAVQHYNPDGLTCIDYLEEIEGEYFMIPSYIRNIYDSLGKGVVIVAIQKKAAADIARGGEATKDKARLYMTLDILCSLEHCVICSLKLSKVKKSLKENMQDKELHFRIERGAHITPLMDWTYSGKVNRQKCIQEYIKGVDGRELEQEYVFMTIEGAEVALNLRDYEAWKRTYKSFDLDAELKRVSDYSYIKSWLYKKNWYWQLGAHLDKKEKDLGQ